METSPKRRRGRKGHACANSGRVHTWRINLDHTAVALVVRWLHVAAMAATFGGAILVTWLALRRDDHLLAIAVRYEQVFWAGIGVLVMTGVGNLGAFGLALPAPSTSWGANFTTKLLFVVALVALSLPRSLVVSRAARGGGSGPLRALYGATVLVFATILALATLLAHG